MKIHSLNSLFLRMWGFVAWSFCWSLNRDQPNHGLLSGEEACRMIPNGSPVNQVQRLDGRLPPTSPPPPLRVCVTILVLVSFCACQSKECAKRKLKSWLGCLHPHVIFTSYDNEILGSFALQKVKYFLQGDRF